MFSQKRLCVLTTSLPIYEVWAEDQGWIIPGRVRTVAAVGGTRKRLVFASLKGSSHFYWAHFYFSDSKVSRLN